MSKPAFNIDDVENTDIARLALDDHPTNIRIMYGGPLSYDLWKRGGDNRVVLNFFNEDYDVFCEMINRPESNWGSLSVKINPRGVPYEGWVHRHSTLLSFQPLRLTLRKSFEKIKERCMDNMRFLEVNGIASGSRYWVVISFDILCEDRNFDVDQYKYKIRNEPAVYLDEGESALERPLPINGPPGIFTYGPMEPFFDLRPTDIPKELKACSPDAFNLLVDTSRAKLGWQVRPEYSREAGPKGYDNGQMAKSVKHHIIDDLVRYWHGHCERVFDAALELCCAINNDEEYTGFPIYVPFFTYATSDRFEVAADALRSARGARSYSNILAFSCIVIIGLRDDVGATRS